VASAYIIESLRDRLAWSTELRRERDKRPPRFSEGSHAGVTRGAAGPGTTLTPHPLSMSETDQQATVFIVDDDPSVRTALRRLLESVGHSCEAFGTATEFLKRAEVGVSGCVLLDVRMPGPSGLDLQRLLKAAGHEIPIIFVTAHADVPLTVRAMKAGAIEVLTKPFDDQSLLDAVQQALERDGTLRRAREEHDRIQHRFDTLTLREREVMGLVVTGLLNKQIAALLGTAEKTVKVHRAQVMHKMGADSVAALVRMADRLQLTKLS
jgi:FixJ family two-component response regulator